MQQLLDSKQMKACDNNTITNHGVPSLLLMEKAAQAVVNEIIKRFSLDSVVGIVCGTGNNGGDGVAICRLLFHLGFHVHFFIIGDQTKYTKELQVEISIAQSYGIEVDTNLNLLNNCDIIVDAIFGIGLCRDVQGEFAQAISTINSTDAFVIAVDIPSGYDADTGNKLGVGILADLTVTFAYGKPGLYLSDCLLNRGTLVIADVGIYLDNPPVGNQVFSLTDEDLILLPERPRNANKGTCGKVLVIAGSEEIYGACYLAAKASMVTGSGLVKIYTHANNIGSIQVAFPEAMAAGYTSFDEDKLSSLLNWADSIIIGPGLGTSLLSYEILKYVLLNATIPTVLDADAINLLSKDISILTNTSAPIILTPHLKEMERLCGTRVSEINKAMIPVASSFATKYHCSIVLKNYVTVIATSDSLYINSSGCEALATAGSGDVLAGIIGSLLGQGLSLELSASLGTFIHGLAGEAAADRLGVNGVLATDIIASITEVM